MEAGIYGGCQAPRSPTAISYIPITQRAIKRGRYLFWGFFFPRKPPEPTQLLNRVPVILQVLLLPHPAPSPASPARGQLHPREPEQPKPPAPEGTLSTEPRARTHRAQPITEHLGNGAGFKRIKRWGAVEVQSSSFRLSALSDPLADFPNPKTTRQWASSPGEVLATAPRIRVTGQRFIFRLGTDGMKAIDPSS